MSFRTMKESSLSVKILHDKVYELLLQDKRLDGRSPLDMRNIDIKTGIVEKAEGSALVSLGGTRILVGIKAEVGTPFADRPTEGVFAVNAELLPLASKSFEPGPPDERGVELARVVDRSLRESKCIDLEKFVLIPHQKVYLLFIDLYILDFDGNYFDPSLIAAVAALSTAKLPKYRVADTKVEKVEGEFVTVPLRTTPFSITIGLLKDKFLVDPTISEESSLDSSIIMSFDDIGNIVAIQKNLPGEISLSMIERLFSVAKDRTSLIRTRFQEAAASGKG